MRRRALLACLATGTLAGCTGVSPSGSLAMEAPTAHLRMAETPDEALPRKVMYAIENTNGERAALLGRIADDGTATVETTGEPPLLVDYPVAGERHVWELDADVVERTPATRYSVVLDVVQESVDPDRAVAYADLPTVDQEKLSSAGLGDGELVGVGTSLLYTDAEWEDAALVPEPDFDYITWENGEAGVWRVDGASSTPLLTYEYGVESSRPLAEYGAEMRERFAFGFESLPDGERDLVERAIDGGFTVDSESTPTVAFESLAARFRGRPRLRRLDEEARGQGGVDGRYLVVYEGATYVTVLSYPASEETTTAEPTTAGTATGDGSTGGTDG